MSDTTKKKTETAVNEMSHSWLQRAVNKVYMAFFSKSLFDEDVEILSADDAYSKSTYGQLMDDNDIIKLHQARINRKIHDCLSYSKDNDDFEEYYCSYTFRSDAIQFIDKILEPFRKENYLIWNLSEKIEDMPEENVYMFSWYKNKNKK